MNKIVFPAIILIAVYCLMGCGDNGNSSPFSVRTITVKDLSDEDVYFVFTNPNTTSTAPASPAVNYQEIDRSIVNTNQMQYRTSSTGTTKNVYDPQLWKLNDIHPSSDAISRSSISLSYAAPIETVGTVKTFVAVTDFDPFLNILATCRGKITYDTRTLVIYVANDSWISGGTRTNLVNQTMVNSLSNKFLFSGPDNDIWDWATDIYGEPWGSHSFDNMVEDGAEKYLTILLYDIQGDNSTTGGILGYFNSNDNFTGVGSNERLMFAMDSVLYATSENGSWDQTDYWPATVFSTLAHEFQHMIHFYQKQILNDVGQTDTWLAEMCSEVTEDLLSNKVGVTGPRGLEPPTEASAGLASNCESQRISYFNYWSDTSLTRWGNTNGDVLFSYSAVYSFGAYIARNYGGAALFREIVQSSWTDEKAVTEAIASLGYGNIDFRTLLIEWAVAAIFSNQVDSQDTYNTGNVQTSSADNPNGSDYSLGSINLYNYEAWTGSDSTGLFGPIPYGNISVSFDPAYLQPTAPASNVIFLAGKRLSGDKSWTVEIPTGMILTVVRK